MQKTKPPYLSIAFMIIGAICITLAILNPFAKIPAATRTQVKAIEAKKDSIVITARTESKSNVTRAQVLQKSLPREEPKITDTTYASMCEYITNYRVSATLEAQ